MSSVKLVVDVQHYIIQNMFSPPLIFIARKHKEVHQYKELDEDLDSHTI